MIVGLCGRLKLQSASLGAVLTINYGRLIELSQCQKQKVLRRDDGVHLSSRPRTSR